MKYVSKIFMHWWPLTYKYGSDEKWRKIIYIYIFVLRMHLEDFVCILVSDGEELTAHQNPEASL